MGKIIIITDLDGTLLHPATYSFDAAMPAITLIEEKGIPLIFCSSKTRAEIEVYRRKLVNGHPFISENGGGIFIPGGYFEIKNGERNFFADAHLFNEEFQYDAIIIGTPYEKIRRVFSELRREQEAAVKGFGDMTVAEVAALAGLRYEEAVFAKEREFGEPFVFEGEADSRFLSAIEKKGLHWTQGRFYHILGDNDKGKAANILKGFYERRYGEVVTIGLGDRFNDLPLLEAVDCPILVQDEDGKYDKRINLPRLIKANGTGPEGWNEAVIRVIKDYSDRTKK